MAMRGKVRKQFTDEQIRAAAAVHQGYKTLGVSRQLFDYWVKQLENGATKADRMIRSQMNLKEPSPFNDEVIDPYNYSTDRILVIPDLHCPYQHPKAFEFLREIRDEIKPTLVVCLGDELDYHAISFHDSDPNLDSAGRELSKARECMAELHEIFPQLKICHSNHGSLVYRRAKAHGLPVEMIKTYREIIFPNGAGRSWSWHHRIHEALPDGSHVIFRHQAAGNLLNAAAHEHASLVVGHFHGKFGLYYAAGEISHFFAVNCGCLIDRESLAFTYGQENRLQAVCGVCVIEDSVPRLIPLR